MLVHIPDSVKIMYNHVTHIEFKATPVLPIKETQIILVHVLIYPIIFKLPQPKDRVVFPDGDLSVIYLYF